MTNEQILKKAINKAVKNGWDKTLYQDILDKFVGDGLDDEYYTFIFSHDFAKAFWGKEEWTDDEYGLKIIAWQQHLQQMVLEEEPLEYIEKFL